MAVLLEHISVGAVSRADDKPLRKIDIDLGQSRYLRPSPRNHILLSCFYYPGLMVKQLDDPGMKGVRWVTITPLVNGQEPQCRRSHGPDEQFIAKGWWGFIGVEKQLLLLEAADGQDDGTAVRVFDLKSKKKIFEDSISLSHFRIEFAHTQDGKVSGMKYLRVVRGDCSLPKDGKACWQRFRQQFGLSQESVPTCTGYEGEQPVPAEEEQTESAITYPVVVELFPQPAIKALSGPITCRPLE